MLQKRSERRKMNLEKIKQGIELAKLLDGETSLEKYPFSVGDKVFIRTVTLYYTGEIISIQSGFLTLKDAAWVCDTGRFADFLKEGKANEVEPFIENVHIPLGSVIDISKWTHKLFREQK